MAIIGSCNDYLSDCTSARPIPTASFADCGGRSRWLDGFSALLITNLDQPIANLDDATALETELLARIDNSGDTTADATLIRMIRGYGDKPASSKETLGKEGCWDYDETVRRDHTINFDVKYMNKANYNMGRQFQCGLKFKVYPVTLCGQVFSYVTRDDAGVVVSYDGIDAYIDADYNISRGSTSEQVWTYTLQWSAFQDPECFSFPFDPCRIINLDTQADPVTGV